MGPLDKPLTFWSRDSGTAVARAGGDGLIDLPIFDSNVDETAMRVSIRWFVYLEILSF